MNGIIVLNKPADITSRDAVNYVSKYLNIKKVGHNGTLDPLARGVLVICIGKYTKLNNLLSSSSKEYIASVKLGLMTDTLDITGKIIKENDDILDVDKLNNTLKKFTKSYYQEVPKYSAIKVNGKKLYEYARKNIDVFIPKRKVRIESIELLKYTEKSFTFKTKVSKGTYIRSLIRDILEDMNVLGTMSDLIRISQGDFRIDDSCDLKDIKNGNYKLIRIKDFLDIPIVKVDYKLKHKIINGCKIRGDYPDKVLFVSDNDEELAIYEKHGELYKVCVMLYC